MGANGKVMYVKCKVYNVMERQDKLMVFKLESLWKHVGQRKAVVAFVCVVVGDFYFIKTNQHVINDKLYVQKGKDNIW